MEYLNSFAPQDLIERTFFPAESLPMKHLSAFCGIALGCLAPCAQAQDPPATIDLSDLPAAVIDDVVIPVPREVFLSLDKLGDHDWAAQVKDSKFDKLGNREQVALLLGVVVADGFVAVQAENSAAVEDIGRHVARLAKALGVADAVTAHAAAISESAKADDWDGVRAELDKIHGSVRDKLKAMRDDDLAILVSAGGWLRGTEVTSTIIAKDYTKESAEILHQPALAKHVTTSLGKHSKSPLSRAIAKQVGEIIPLLSLEGDSVPEFAVQKVRDVTASSVTSIITNAK